MTDQDFSRNYSHRSRANIRDWFEIAMDRVIPNIVPMPNNALPVLNLGAGYRMIGDSIPLDLERGWDADSVDGRIYLPKDTGSDRLYLTRSDSVAGIWAHGFFEHISDPIRMLKECQRVLCPGGVLNICVPHGMSELAWEDLTHKHQFQEGSWKNLMANPYYRVGDEDRWTLRVRANFIMGTVWRNMALFTQMINDPKLPHYWEE